jgi:chain length determinant protein EpsF
MTPQQYLLVIWARRRLVLAAGLAVVIVTLIVGLMMPKKYTASVAMLLNVKFEQTANMVSSNALQSYLADQIEIIQSARVALRVVKQLPRERVDAVCGKQGTEDEESFDYDCARLVQSGLVVKPSHGSNIIDISYSATNPEFAAIAANAFSRAYIDTTVEFRMEPMRQDAAWYEDQLKGLRAALEKAESNLSAYQKEKGVVVSDERLDLETARLNTLTTQLSEVQGHRVETSSREKNTGSELSPDVQQSPVIQGIKLDLSRAEAKLSEVSANMGPNHPQRVELEAQVGRLKQQLNEETKRIAGGASTAHRTTVQQEDELKGLIAQQKKKVLSLLSAHDEISVLTRDVENAQRAYASVAEGMRKDNVDSQTRQTTLNVLKPAMPPSRPSRPDLLRNFLASVGGGLLLGILLAIAIEMVDRRVRNIDDLAIANGVPVLGVLQPRIPSSLWRRHLALATGARTLRIGHSPAYAALKAEPV